METISQKQVENRSIEDCSFFPPTDEEKNQIRSFIVKGYKNKGKKRFLYSLPVCFVILVSEIFARLSAPAYSYSGIHYFGEEHMVSTILWICSLFAVFHVVSILQLFLKYKLNETADRYECLHGLITDKYDSRHMTVDAKRKIPNYVLFDCEQGHCTTALPVSDNHLFCFLSISDPILVIRHNRIGAASYDFIPLRK